MTARTFARWALAVLFVAAGVNHFVNPEFYRPMMPPYLPSPGLLIALSGVLEVVGGLALLWTKARTAASWGLIAILVGVFPANLHMALNPELFPDFPEAALWGRLPLQLVLIGWAWWVGREHPRHVGSRSPSP